jgi:hypothetical protein
MRASGMMFKGFAMFMPRFNLCYADLFLAVGTDTHSAICWSRTGIMHGRSLLVLLLRRVLLTIPMLLAMLYVLTLLLRLLPLLLHLYNATANVTPTATSTTAGVLAEIIMVAAIPATRPWKCHHCMLLQLLTDLFIRPSMIVRIVQRALVLPMLLVMQVLQYN